MTDAPERIWAVPERNCTVYMSGNSPITAQDGPFTHRLHGAASEYIRADLVAALQAENQRLRDALRECEGALDLHGKMYPAMVKGYTLDALNAARAALRSTREGG